MACHTIPYCIIACDIMEYHSAAEQMCSIPCDIVTDEFPRASTFLALSKAREKPSLLLSTVAADIADQSILMEYAQEAAPEGVWGT